MPDYQPPQPAFSSRREELEVAVAELEAQREEAECNLAAPDLSAEDETMLQNTIKGLDILLGHARRELDELEHNDESGYKQDTR